MKDLYQQKTICKALGLKKQRIEYLTLKVEIKPVIPAQGTGTTNFFDFAGLISIDIADCLSMWGFEFLKIRQILEELRQRVPDIFVNDQDGRQVPPDEHKMLLLRGLPKKRRSGDMQSYLTDIRIGSSKEFLARHHATNLNDYQAPYGVLTLDLTLRKSQAMFSL